MRPAPETFKSKVTSSEASDLHLRGRAPPFTPSAPGHSSLLLIAVGHLITALCTFCLLFVGKVFTESTGDANRARFETIISMRGAQRPAVGSERSKGSAAAFFDSGLMQRALDSLPPQLCRLASGVRVARGYCAFDASCSRSLEFSLDLVGMLRRANRRICSFKTSINTRDSDYRIDDVCTRAAASSVP